jgi:hypothetical protein
MGVMMVKSEYWDISDSQSLEKTGKSLDHWMKVLDEFKAGDRKSNEAVDHLQRDHGVGRYWARTLTTHYLKRGNQ